MAGISKAALSKRWVHSHEEDREGERVYRPSGFKFPRARGRVAIELKDDGTAEYVGIGRGDKPEGMPGKWTLETGPREVIRLKLESGETMNLRVVSFESGRLVVKQD